MDVAGELGEHVSTPEPSVTTTDASSDQTIAIDGGTTVREASEGAGILEDDDADPWKGPFYETDKYGQLSGAKYYRCRGCAREVHEDIDREYVTHREGCRFDE